MTKTSLVCDQCGKPIDPKSNISLVPLRGGLDIITTTPAGVDTKKITSHTSFCDGACVADWLRGIKVAALLILASLLSFLSLSANAGTFFSFTSISGTNQAQVFQSWGNPYAYPSFVQVPQQTLVLTNVQTNEAIWLAYGAQITGQSGTNIVVSTSFVTNLTPANGWTVFPTNFIYVTPAYGTNVYVSPWGIIGISSNGVIGPYAQPYTNGATWN